MLVAAIQHDIEWEAPQRNFERLRPRIESAVAEGASLVVLSEMWSTGFSMNSKEIAEAPDGPTAQFMHEMAASTGAWITGSFPEHTEGYDLPTNRLLLAGPGGEDHRYSKIHPFTFAKEDRHYAAGSDTITVEIEGVKVTPLICYDLRFTDLFWDRATTTDCFIVPANWPKARRQHWMTLLWARAIENQAYVVGVNRVGSAGRLDYSGDSRIIDPLGEMVEATMAQCSEESVGKGIIDPLGEMVEATPGEETTVCAEVSSAVVAQVRADFPFMQDR